MRAKYCKKKNTYTTEECRCNCREIWKQGVGSLVGQGEDNYTNTNISRSDRYIARTDSDGVTKEFKGKK